MLLKLILNTICLVWLFNLGELDCWVCGILLILINNWLED